MGKFIDITGQRFGRLVVLEKAEKRGKNWFWRCKCDCGQEKLIDGRNLRGGYTKSCGCLSIELSTQRLKNATYKDIANQKFGHLTAIEDIGVDNRGEHKWKCLCDCGNPEPIIVLGGNLRSGHTTSCGCIRQSKGETAIEKILQENNIIYEVEKPMFKYSNGYYAKFDFYINNNYLLEYDGETHYLANLHGWHTQEQLSKQQERDIIKNQWCKDNGIPLIRIPYTHLKDLCLNDLLLETSKFIIT